MIENILALTFTLGLFAGIRALGEIVHLVWTEWRTRRADRAPRRRRGKA